MRKKVDNESWIVRDLRKLDGFGAVNLKEPTEDDFTRIYLLYTETLEKIAELEAQLEHQGIALGRSRLDDLGALEQFKTNVLRLSKEIKEARAILNKIRELGEVKSRHPANTMLCPYCMAEEYLKDNPE